MDAVERHELMEMLASLAARCRDGLLRQADAAEERAASALDQRAASMDRAQARRWREHAIDETMQLEC